jgi:hypothetical protein
MADPFEDVSVAVADMAEAWAMVGGFAVLPARMAQESVSDPPLALTVRTITTKAHQLNLAGCKAFLQPLWNTCDAKSLSLWPSWEVQ